MRSAIVTSLAVALSHWSIGAVAQHVEPSLKACDGIVPAAAVEIYPDRLIRPAVPVGIFGFNVPWRDFQIGYFRKGAVRPEVIQWLAPFKGALYRYPGGSLSNTFDWKRAVGPASDRPLQRADFGRMARVEFGFAEFGAFLQQVDGKAMFTLNMSGPPEAQMSAAVASVAAVGAVRAIRSESSFLCNKPNTCLLKIVELGNELDWNPYLWDSSKYVSRAKDVIASLDSEIPGLDLVANGRTAPWDAKVPNFHSFNREVADALAGRVRGIAIHPYYEGIPVPEALRFVDSYAAAWARGREDPQVYVTEHGRWPSVPPVGRWENNWYQTTSLGGAVATADFVLGLLPNPQVAAANWHALAADGPWQLFQWDRQSDQLTPTPLYWALRTLREGLLEDVVEVSILPIADQPHLAKSVRLVAMRRQSDGMVSLLGVNRSNHSVQLVLQGSAARLTDLRIVGGGEPSAVNTVDRPNTVIMESSKVAASQTRLPLCIPRSSVFSVSLGSEAGSR